MQEKQLFGVPLEKLPYEMRRQKIRQQRMQQEASVARDTTVARATTSALFDSSAAPTSLRSALPSGSSAPASPPPDESAAAHLDDMTLGRELEPELGFQESSLEETGMTTAHDLPGFKTLAPGSASKQRVAHIAFRGVVFSYTIVAKYKPVVYLMAKLKHASKLTLLKGTVGLTLDRSFLGRTKLHRCSAGDTFQLSLGVDPAIRVAYPKPDVKRETTGIFSKEDSGKYERSVIISNTWASVDKPMTLVVVDQVPVSEDEKLRVELQQPQGLSVGAGSVAPGVGMVTATASGGAAKESSSSSAPAKDWGLATVTLKKAGEIVWDVKLNAGRSVKLDLVYDISAPTARA